MTTLCRFLSFAFFLGACIAAPAPAPAWNFILQNTTSGIIALEAIVVSPTLVVFFDNVNANPLMINNHSAWGALWDLETSTVRPLDPVTNTFCASGALLSNGTMASVGGNPVANTAEDGTTAIRLFGPCTDPAGTGCELFEDPATLNLAAHRWYPSSIRIFDGSLMIVGGATGPVSFYNIIPDNTIEFFPSKDGGVPRQSAFLERTLPANLFPRIFALPDGKVFMVANNQSIIYDIEANTETVLPDLPNGVRVTNPLDGSAILLPLSPPLYTPEVLVCGGSAIDDSIQPANLSSQDPASTQCSRITLTPEGIENGWEVEHMLEGRMMPELVHVPNGQVLIINGAQTGYPTPVPQVQDAIGNSNADHPAFTPSLYTPDLPLGQRISNESMPTTDIARMYHSSVTLTPQGNFLVAGSNPNPNIVVVGNGIVFPSEYRVQTLNPPFMTMARPSILNIPDKLGFRQRFTVPISIPVSLPVHSVKLALMDLGFSSHAFHSGARLVFMDAQVSQDRRSLTFTTPPNGRVYPPGPATVFLTVDDVTSPGVRVMMGSGASPPVAE